MLVPESYLRLLALQLMVRLIRGLRGLSGACSCAMHLSSLLRLHDPLVG